MSTREMVTANVFCAVKPKRGVYLNKVTRRRTSDEFAKFLVSVERRYRHAERIILVMVKMSPHKIYWFCLIFRELYT